MRTSIKCFFILLTILVNASCYKNKPPEGDYFLILNRKIELDSGDSMLIEHKSFIRITESNKSELIILSANQEYVLAKSKYDILGLLRTNETWTPGGTWYYDSVNIIGYWKKENGKYRIDGNFDGVYHYAINSTQTSGNNPVEGTFEIVPQE